MCARRDPESKMAKTGRAETESGRQEASKGRRTTPAGHVVITGITGHSYESEPQIRDIRRTLCLSGSAQTQTKAP
jgi:hypothetical protein